MKKSFFSRLNSFFAKQKKETSFLFGLTLFVVLSVTLICPKVTFAAGESTSNFEMIKYIYTAVSSLATGATNVVSTVYESLFGPVITSIAYVILGILSYIVDAIGIIFNIVISITVINMSSLINKIDIIKAGWQAIRDLTNIIFIFMLLYLAIATILQLDEHGVKHGLSRLIIGATLINFSLFFVKVPIDVSNILAIQIYNKVNPPSDSTFVGALSGRKGLGDAFFQMFSPQKVFKDPRLSNLSSNAGPTGSLSGDVLRTNPLTTFVMGIIIFLIIIFIFLAVIIIFIKRFIVLMLLMIFSPLAFAGMAVPSHDIEHQITSRFWNTLFKEAFYAPVFMFLMYLALKMGTALNTNVIREVDASSGIDRLVTLPLSNVIGFSVVIGMMVFALTVSESMGVAGASNAVNAFGMMRSKATGFIASNTAGRLAHTWVNKGNGANFTMAAAGLKNSSGTAQGKLANFLSRSSLGRSVAKQVAGTAQNIGKKDFGGGFSYDHKIHEREEEFKAALEEAHNDPKMLAELMGKALGDGNKRSTSLKAAHRMFHHMSLEEKANLQLNLDEKIKEGEKTDKDGKPVKPKAEIDALKAARANLFGGGEKHEHGRLTENESVGIVREIAEGTDYHAKKFRAAIESGDASSVGHFIENATEGQMKVALRSLGDMENLKMKPVTADTPKEKIKEYEIHNQKVQNITNQITNGLSKFRGESFHAMVAKDTAQSETIKEVASTAVLKGQKRYQAFQAFSGSNEKINKALALGNPNLRQGFADELRDLPQMRDHIQKYDERQKNIEKGLEEKLKTARGDAAKEAHFKAEAEKEKIKAFEEDVVQKYDETMSESTTFKYAKSPNGERTVIQTKEMKEELGNQEKIFKTLEEETKKQKEAAGGGNWSQKNPILFDAYGQPINTK